MGVCVCVCEAAGHALQCVCLMIFGVWVCVCVSVCDFRGCLRCRFYCIRSRLPATKVAFQFPLFAKALAYQSLLNIQLCKGIYISYVYGTWCARLRPHIWLRNVGIPQELSKTFSATSTSTSSNRFSFCVSFYQLQTVFGPLSLGLFQFNHV